MLFKKARQVAADPVCSADGWKAIMPCCFRCAEADGNDNDHGNSNSTCGLNAVVPYDLRSQLQTNLELDFNLGVVLSAYKSQGLDASQLTESHQQVC